MVRSSVTRTARTAIETVSLRKQSQYRNNSKQRYYSIWAWGTSTFPSLLAEEQTKDRKVLTPLRIDTQNVFNIDPNSDVVVKEFVCGANNSGAVLSDGRCFVWGANKNGQLGLGHMTTDVSIPTLLTLQQTASDDGRSDPVLNSNLIRSLHLGSTFSAAVDTNGNLFTFGYGGSAFGGMGWLGHGDSESHLKPKLVESLVEDGCEVQDVQVGDSHMAVLTTEGEFLTTGSGAYGRLGNLDTTDQLFLEPVEILAGTIIRQISCGHSFTLALTTDGIIYSFGKNDKGQLGTGGGMMVDMYAMSSLPTVIEGHLENRNIVKVSAGHSHSACITDKGELFIWGMNLYLEPTLVSSITRCVDVACGENYTIVLTDDGLIYSFGKGGKGVLGHGNTGNLNDPTLVVAMADKTVLQMSAGLSHFACMATERTPGGNPELIKRTI